MEIRLKGKNAIVCGSTQGIGKAVALELANVGASVTLVARNEEALKVVQSELNANDNQTHQYLCADFSHPEELDSKIDAYVKNNPLVHILLNNSGGPLPGAILDAKTASFEEAFSKHIICNQILVQTLVPGMKAENYGRIINIISTYTASASSSRRTSAFCRISGLAVVPKIEWVLSSIRMVPISP